MTLDEEIRNRFVSDAETILEAHLDDLEGMFEFHEDGTMELLGDYRGMKPEDKILLIMIARRYQYEGGLADDPFLPYSEFYSRFPDKDESTIRGYFMNLRGDRFVRKDESGHELVVERLPSAIERINKKVDAD